jgi:hypothetical protein
MNSFAHYEATEHPGILALAETEEMFNGHRVRVPPGIAYGAKLADIVWPKQRFVRRNGLGLWYGGIDCSNLWAQEYYIYIQQLRGAVQEALALMGTPMDGDEDYEFACRRAIGGTNRTILTVDKKAEAKRILSGRKPEPHMSPALEPLKAIAAKAVHEYVCKYGYCGKKFLSVMPREFCSGDCKMKHEVWQEVQARTSQLEQDRA